MGLVGELVAEGLGCKDLEFGAVGAELLDEVECRCYEPLKNAGFNFFL